VNAEPSRLAAYADLVAAVLDLRNPGPQQAFDAALGDAVAAGTVSADVARQLRWLQRASERAIVEQAESVLPPALDALQANVSAAPSPEALAPLGHAAEASPPRTALPETALPETALPETALPETALSETATPSPAGPPGPTGPPGPEAFEEPDPATVIELPARRLLVAGLRPLPPPANRGTLP
jgi:hypothetical protein